MKNFFQINLKYIIISYFLISSVFASNIEPVKNFNVYPISKNATSISRGGTLNDKSAMEDGIGTVLIGGVGNESNDINNKVYNKTLKNNIINLSNNTNLKDLSININDLNVINNNKFVKLHNINGTSCNDGNEETIDEVWLNDICQGGKPLIKENEPCDDGHAETINDFIKNGVCLSGELTKITNKSLIKYKEANFSIIEEVKYNSGSGTNTIFDNDYNYTGTAGWFYWSGLTYFTLKIDSNFKIWTYGCSAYLNDDAQLQFKNVNTGMIIKSSVSDYGRNTVKWREVSQTIPSGSYKITTILNSGTNNTSVRTDCEWFIENINTK